MLRKRVSCSISGCSTFIFLRPLIAAQQVAGWPQCRTNQAAGRGVHTAKSTYALEQVRGTEGEEGRHE